jgi:hypothetical protein
VRTLQRGNPSFEKMYSKKDESLEFISISIDEDKNAWKKALNEEKMDWKQFIINGKDPNYEKIQMHFRLNGAIPYTVLLDNNSKILRSTVGLSSEKDLMNFINDKSKRFKFFIKSNIIYSQAIK